MKNGLVSTTEKSLKDAVISLRKDMTDVTSRIKDLEERLNQLTRVQNNEKVMVSTIYTDCIQRLSWDMTLVIFFLLFFRITGSLSFMTKKNVNCKIRESTKTLPKAQPVI